MKVWRKYRKAEAALQGDADAQVRSVRGAGWELDTLVVRAETMSIYASLVLKLA